MTESRTPKKRVPARRPPLAEGGLVDRAHTDQLQRQDDQEVTQTDQGQRQDDQGVRQDEQGVTQDEQGVTQIRQGLMQSDQADAIAANTVQILAITDGVGLLAANVERLNTGVYAKNKLDKARNRLILGAAITFVVLSAILGSLLWRLNDTANEEARRATDRATEAVEVRHQLADCTTPPGTVLEAGYVNPGECFTASAKRTQSYIDNATARIEEDMRRILAGLADAVATNKSLTTEVRQAAAAQARILRAPPPSTPAPPAAVVQQPPATSPPPAPVVPAPTGLGRVVCDVLSLIGACG